MANGPNDIDINVGVNDADARRGAAGAAGAIEDIGDAARGAAGDVNQLDQRFARLRQALTRLGAGLRAAGRFFRSLPIRAVTNSLVALRTKALDAGKALAKLSVTAPLNGLKALGGAAFNVEALKAAFAGLAAFIAGTLAAAITKAGDALRNLTDAQNLDLGAGGGQRLSALDSLLGDAGGSEGDAANLLKGVQDRTKQAAEAVLAYNDAYRQGLPDLAKYQALLQQQRILMGELNRPGYRRPGVAEAQRAQLAQINQQLQEAGKLVGDLGSAAPAREDQILAGIAGGEAIQQLSVIIGQLSQISDEGERIRAANKLLGDDLGRQLAPLLRGTPEELTKQFRERLSAINAGGTEGPARELTASLGQLRAELTGLGNETLREVGPTISAFFSNLGKVIRDNREDIVSGIKAVTDSVLTLVGGVATVVGGTQEQKDQLFADTEGTFIGFILQALDSAVPKIKAYVADLKQDFADLQALLVGDEAAAADAAKRSPLLAGFVSQIKSVGGALLDLVPTFDQLSASLKAIADTLSTLSQYTPAAYDKRTGNISGAYNAIYGKNGAFNSALRGALPGLDYAANIYNLAKGIGGNASGGSPGRGGGGQFGGGGASGSYDFNINVNGQPAATATVDGFVRGLQVRNRQRAPSTNPRSR